MADNLTCIAWNLYHPEEALFQRIMVIDNWVVIGMTDRKGGYTYNTLMFSGVTAARQAGVNATANVEQLGFELRLGPQAFEIREHRDSVELQLSAHIPSEKVNSNDFLNEIFMQTALNGRRLEAA